MGSGSSPPSRVPWPAVGHPGVVGTCFTQAWLTSLICRHRCTELWPAGPQTLLPAGRHPLHLWRYHHRPVSESEGGHRGARGPHSGMFRGAWVMGSLKWCLPLGVHGRSRDQPSVPIGWVGKVGGRAGQSGSGARCWCLSGSLDVRRPGVPGWQEGVLCGRQAGGGAEVLPQPRSPADQAQPVPCRAQTSWGWGRGGGARGGRTPKGGPRTVRT